MYKQLSILVLIIITAFISLTYFFAYLPAKNEESETTLKLLNPSSYNMLNSLLNTANTSRLYINIDDDAVKIELFEPYRFIQVRPQRSYSLSLSTIDFCSDLNINVRFYFKVSPFGDVVIIKNQNALKANTDFLVISKCLNEHISKNINTLVIWRDSNFAFNEAHQVNNYLSWPW